MSDDPAKKIEIDDSVVDDLLGAVDDDTDDTDPVNDAPDEPEAPKKPVSQYARRQAKAASVTPIHEAPKKKRGPGRPKKIDTTPTSADLEYHKQVMAEQTEFVESDEIVKVSRERSESVETLYLIKERIALSAASLEFHRLELQKRGVSNREIPQIISRQIAAMKEIAAVEAEIRKLGVDAIDLKNERLQRVFGLLINTFRDVAKEMLEPQQFDLMWNKLENKLEGWEDEADSLLR